jgi:hypothetical protein
VCAYGLQRGPDRPPGTTSSLLHSSATLMLSALASRRTVRRLGSRRPFSTSEMKPAVTSARQRR